MHKIITPALTLCLMAMLSLFACQTGTETSKANGGEATEVPPAIVDGDMANKEESSGDDLFNIEMRSKSYKKLLEGGRWVNQTEFTNRIAFAEGEFTVYDNENLLSTAAYSIDISCTKDACQADGQAPSGWCFSVDGECYEVTELNMRNLRCKKIGEANTILYKRIKG